MNLSPGQWKKAKDYVQQNARPLEQKLFNYHFEEGSKDEAIHELSCYQNEDGGFGRSIEPDFRLDSSSPLATTIGLQKAKELKLTASHPIVQKAMNYLQNEYNEENEGWNAVPEKVNSVPHAPWWHFDLERGHCGVQTTWANPNAEIVGYFHRFQPDHPRLKEWTEKAIIELTGLVEPIDMHDFLCYEKLLNEVEGKNKSTLFNILSTNVRKTVCTDPERWNEYVAKPLQVASEPSSPFYEILEDVVQIQLGKELESQHHDGFWQPTWSWFGHYEETWPDAETEWRGILTLEMLKVFKAHHMLVTI
ncbi:hypothetical protein N5C46_03995 [Rossellomorea vietnamensis]|uniref:Uncharacterized protein n=1 Tax=Rossellomorea vietnamensis TaxID=218284 RepID=A0ACD4C9L0_9BACI|nr:hypothetical protein [Rossellomorea vietnamensis]UXH45235.1 hypothetical protein N5C46_03995 [Rossellomorea vietnamensis]